MRIPDQAKLERAIMRHRHLKHQNLSLAAIHVHHRISRDADPTLDDLKGRFDQILATLEAVAGWKTARVRRPVQILGSL